MPTDDQASALLGEGPTESIEVTDLLREFTGGDPEVHSRETDDETGSTADSIEQTAGPLIEDIVDDVSPHATFRFDEEIVKHNLSQLLLVLVEMRSGETHGKALMDDLWRLFDTRLSPGTVYPALHGLEESDLLEVFELVRTKEYRIDATDEARSQVLDAAQQHLVLGLLFLSAGSQEF